MKKLAFALLNWAYTPARWWQFWMPSSGPVGGILAGLVFIGLLMVIFAHLG